MDRRVFLKLAGVLALSPAVIAEAAPGRSKHGVAKLKPGIELAAPGLICMMQFASEEGPRVTVVADDKPVHVFQMTPLWMLSYWPEPGAPIEFTTLRVVANKPGLCAAMVRLRDGRVYHQTLEFEVCDG